MELISVVILAYNAEKTIKRCLKSILNQTIDNYEVIVINDGSIDNTSKIIKEINNNKIKLIERENKGTYYSRVEGYKKSSGDYIVYVDSDDYIEKNMLEVLYKKIKKYNVDIVHFQNKILKGNKITSTDNLFKEDKIITKEELYNLLYKTINMNAMWKQMYKRKVLKNIDVIDRKLLYGEDLVCNIEAYKSAKSILCINDQLYVYMINDNGITKKTSKNKLMDIVYVYGELFNSVSYFKLNKDYKKIVTLKTYYYLATNLAALTDCSKEEFIEIANEIINKDEIKRLYKYINYDYKTLNIKNKVIIKSCNLLINKQFSKLYYYDKYIYNVLKKLR